MKDVPLIEQAIGYSFRNRQLLLQAFVHRSYVNESRDVVLHNERLEFLGDSILGLLISDYLYHQMPDVPEGELSILRSRLVEASSCMNYFQTLHLEPYILLGKGERLEEGRGRETILADLFEALIGAIYLDGGYDAAKQFLFSHFQEEIDHILNTPSQNWKAMLQDYCQKNYKKTPVYVLLEESGPDHRKFFTISVVLDNKTLGQGTGNSKKIAQQAAAADAMAKIKQR